MTSSHSSVSMSNVVAQPGTKEVSKSELRERISLIIPNCTQFLIHEGIHSLFEPLKISYRAYCRNVTVYYS